jgi:hypothetical protein
VTGSTAVLTMGNDFRALFINRALAVSGDKVGSRWSISATAQAGD